jgi:hypothetical protein
MYGLRSQLLAFALLVLCAVAATLLAFIAVFNIPVMPAAAVGVFAMLVIGIVFLHGKLREARWDAGLRLR